MVIQSFKFSINLIKRKELKKLSILFLYWFISNGPFNHTLHLISLSPHSHFETLDTSCCAACVGTYKWDYILFSFSFFPSSFLFHFLNWWFDKCESRMNFEWDRLNPIGIRGCKGRIMCNDWDSKFW